MKSYLLSFTAVSLAYYESEVVAKLYLKTGDWDKVYKEVVEDNILQKGTISTRKREFVEIKKRLLSLSKDELELFEDSSSSDIKNLCILGCFKTYRFLYEFAVEVLRHKLFSFDYVVLDSDYENYVDSKELLYQKLSNISQTTKYKIKQVTFKIFEQAEFIDGVKSRNIQKPYLSKALVEAIYKDDKRLLKAFLYSDGDIENFEKEFI